MSPLKKIAITREPSAAYHQCSLEFIQRRAIDMERARDQHRAYVNSLRIAGMEVMVLPAVDTFPDCCFVEDTAVVLGDAALITNMGSDSRNGEQQQVADCLAQWCHLLHMRSPATLEGGDVLRVDDYIFVGRSRRTNDAGIETLREFAMARGYKVRCIPVETYLHLKTAVTYVGKDTFITTLQMEHDIKRAVEMESYIVKAVPKGSEYAANSLLVNEKVFLPSGYPQVVDYLNGCGILVEELQMSEFQKGEGGLTCLSIML